jgi:hypothetical protein
VTHPRTLLEGEQDLGATERSLAVDLVQVSEEVMRLFDAERTSNYIRADAKLRAAVTEADLHLLAAGFLELHNSLGDWRGAA